MKSALIISTYNSPDRLRLCLKSITNQMVFPDEILIADDGSGEATKEVINDFNNISDIPIIHIWHEDQGFRKSLILNKAIAKSSSDYIIQIDGDLILDSFFIKDHLDFARPNSLVRASRVYLDEDITAEKIALMTIDINRFDKRVSNFFSSFRIPFLRVFFEENYKNKGNERWEIHGCNMAYWREDAIKVNGYNEDFVGWGPEDKEFVARLLNLGVKKRFLKFGAIVFHLWHKINSRGNLLANELIFEETKFEKKTFCSNGVHKYLNL